MIFDWTYWKHKGKRITSVTLIQKEGCFSHRRGDKQLVHWFHFRNWNVEINIMRRSNENKAIFVWHGAKHAEALAADACVLMSRVNTVTIIIIILSSSFTLQLDVNGIRPFLSQGMFGTNSRAMFFCSFISTPIQIAWTCGTKYVLDMMVCWWFVTVF